MPLPKELSEKWLKLAIKLDFDSNQVEEKLIRGSGKGGQKINKTASSVQLIHQTTGIIIKCQKHREQSKNRVSAYKLLLLKLEQEALGEESEIARKIHKLRKQKQKRSKRAQEKLLADKKHHGELKANRKKIGED
jgi:protein subunit release factor B